MAWSDTHGSGSPCALTGLLGGPGWLPQRWDGTMYILVRLLLVSGVFLEVLLMLSRRFFASAATAAVLWAFVPLSSASATPSWSSYVDATFAKIASSSGVAIDVTSGFPGHESRLHSMYKFDGSFSHYSFSAADTSLEFDGKAFNPAKGMLSDLWSSKSYEAQVEKAAASVAHGTTVWYTAATSDSAYASARAVLSGLLLDCSASSPTSCYSPTISAVSDTAVEFAYGPSSSDSSAVVEGVAQLDSDSAITSIEFRTSIKGKPSYVSGWSMQFAPQTIDIPQGISYDLHSMLGALSDRGIIQESDLPSYLSAFGQSFVPDPSRSERPRKSEYWKLCKYNLSYLRVLFSGSWSVSMTSARNDYLCKYSNRATSESVVVALPRRPLRSNPSMKPAIVFSWGAYRLKVNI